MYVVWLSFGLKKVFLIYLKFILKGLAVANEKPTSQIYIFNITTGETYDKIFSTNHYIHRMTVSVLTHVAQPVIQSKFVLPLII